MIKYGVAAPVGIQLKKRSRTVCAAPRRSIKPPIACLDDPTRTGSIVGGQAKVMQDGVTRPVLFDLKNCSCGSAETRGGCSVERAIPALQHGNERCLTVARSDAETMQKAKAVAILI